MHIWTWICVDLGIGADLEVLVEVHNHIHICIKSILPPTRLHIHKPGFCWTIRSLRLEICLATGKRFSCFDEPTRLGLIRISGLVREAGGSIPPL